MTQHTWKLANLETHIQQLLESVGLHSHGLATLKEIKGLQSPHIIDITLTVSCAKNSATVPTMEANPTPSQPKLSSQSPSSKISNPSISEPSLRTYNGKDGLMISFEDLATWLRSQGASDGSLVDEMTHLYCAKVLHMIHKALWLTL